MPTRVFANLQRQGTSLKDCKRLIKYGRILINLKAINNIAKKIEIYKPNKRKINPKIFTVNKELGKIIEILLNSRIPWLIKTITKPSKKKKKVPIGLVFALNKGVKVIKQYGFIIFFNTIYKIIYNN